MADKSDDSKPDGGSRRRFRRHPQTRFVWYQAFDAAGPQPHEGLSYSLDLSRGGLGLVTKDPIPEGTMLLVEIVFDNLKYHMSTVCRVVHCRSADDASYRVGLEYIILPPYARKFLSERYG